VARLTRSRTRQPWNVLSPLNACYYARRASAAHIVTEATGNFRRVKRVAFTSRKLYWTVAVDFTQLVYALPLGPRGGPGSGTEENHHDD
jgi:hypothetical protein